MSIDRVEQQLAAMETAAVMDAEPVDDADHEAQAQDIEMDGDDGGYDD